MKELSTIKIKVILKIKKFDLHKLLFQRILFTHAMKEKKKKKDRHFNDLILCTRIVIVVLLILKIIIIVLAVILPLPVLLDLLLFLGLWRRCRCGRDVLLQHALVRLRAEDKGHNVKCRLAQNRVLFQKTKKKKKMKKKKC